MSPLVGESTEGPTHEGTAKTHDFEFLGTGEEYFRIWIVNILLTVATLGIYSAWAKVRTKNYFYRNTRVDGAGFEYHADPKKILKGRLIVGAVFGTAAAAQSYSPVLYSIIILLLMLATPAIVVLSLAFNARNSSYRNVRFSFQGTIGEGYGTYMIAGLVQMVTLGLGMPYSQWRMIRFGVSSHQYGFRRFRWTARAGQFYRLYLSGALFLLPALIFMGVFIALAANQKGQGGEPDPGTMFMIAGAVFALYASFFLAFGVVRAGLANIVFGELSIGPHTFRSNQRALGLIGIYFSNLFLSGITFGLYTPWAKVALARYRAEHLQLVAQGDIIEENAPTGVGGVLGDAATDLGDFDLDLGF